MTTASFGRRPDIHGAVLGLFGFLGSPVVDEPEAPVEPTPQPRTEFDNYPSGMTPCEVAGMNGDAPAGVGCPFLGEDFCNCDPIDEEN